MKVESKVFYNPVAVQDFPVRGKKLFLNVRRRRWIVKEDGRYVSRNWKLIAEGNRMTHKFASFKKNYIDTLPISSKLLGFLFGVDSELLECQCRNHLSGYMNWNQLSHAEEWILFKKNIGPHVGLDKVSLSQGELYTILINKKKGRSRSIIAIIKGMDVICPAETFRTQTDPGQGDNPRHGSEHGTAARICFPAVHRVTDRFHVQKLAYETIQEMRVKTRWEALDEESIQMTHAKACGKIYYAPVFKNRDSRKRLLARSIYLLYKKESLWTESQRVRATILFKEYPDIKKAYHLSMKLGLMYHQCKHKNTVFFNFVVPQCQFGPRHVSVLIVSEYLSQP